MQLRGKAADVMSLQRGKIDAACKLDKQRQIAAIGADGVRGLPTLLGQFGEPGVDHCVHCVTSRVTSRISW